MNRHDSIPTPSNRLASRRLHRRLGSSAFLPCVVNTSHVDLRSKAPATGAGLVNKFMQDNGLFELLSAELRIAELEKALAEVSDAACTDPLTGALNRRGFDKACRRELARARRKGGSLALAHIDLDNFKQLNDTFGHHAGDKALVFLVDVLHRSMRPADVVCRFGGEEFVLMFPETDLDKAVAAISRFLNEFSAQAIPGTDCIMTFSAGVVVPGIEESVEAAIARADVATYVAKHAGKNCVVAG